MTALEAKIRARDRKGTISWPWWSRIWWLAVGDAPSCIFAQMKAKLVSETFHSIRKQDGAVLVDEGDILNYIGTTYTDIFSKDSQIQANSQEC